MQRLSNDDLAERTRASNRKRSERHRQRLTIAGHAALTVWVPAQLKKEFTDRADALALNINQLATQIIEAGLRARIDALADSAIAEIPQCQSPAAPDPLPLFEPDSTDSKPVDSDTDSDQQDALMLEVDRLVNAGEKWRDIARILNDAGCRDKKDRPLVFSRLNEQWRVWKQSL